MTKWLVEMIHSGAVTIPVCSVSNEEIDVICMSLTVMIEFIFLPLHWTGCLIVRMIMWQHCNCFSVFPELFVLHIINWGKLHSHTYFCCRTEENRLQSPITLRAIHQHSTKNEYGKLDCFLVAFNSRWVNRARLCTLYFVRWRTPWYWLLLDPKSVIIITYCNFSFCNETATNVFLRNLNWAMWIWESEISWK